MPRFLKTTSEVGDGVVGLRVAYASEGQEYVPMPSTAQGMTPISLSQGLVALFRLNLSVEGAGYDSVAYEIVDSCVIDYSYAVKPFSRMGVAFRRVAKGSSLTPAGAVLSAFEWLPASDATDGEAGVPYVLEVGVSPDDFWTDDDILEAYRVYAETQRAWLFGTAEPSGVVLLVTSDDVELAKADVAFALAGKMTSYAALSTWMRGLYVRYLRLCAQTLENCRLQVRVSAGGGETVRSYAIAASPDFNDVAGRVFDALLARNGFRFEDGVGIFDSEGQRVELGVDGLPFWSFVEGELDEQTAREYACTSLFSIREV